MDSIITNITDGLLVPLIGAITAPIPFLAGSGVLLLLFAGLWLAFAAALARDPVRIDAAWHRLRSMPLIVQAVAWLLFLPILAGVWVWRATWPLVARVTVLCALAGWNVLLFLPGPA